MRRRSGFMRRAEPCEQRGPIAAGSGARGAHDRSRTYISTLVRLALPLSYVRASFDCWCKTGTRTAPVKQKASAGPANSTRMYFPPIKSGDRSRFDIEDV